MSACWSRRAKNRPSRLRSTRNLVDRQVARASLDAREPRIKSSESLQIKPAFGGAVHIRIERDVRDREALGDQERSSLQVRFQNTERACALLPPRFELLGARGHRIRIELAETCAGNDVVHVL